METRRWRYRSGIGRDEDADPGGGDLGRKNRGRGRQPLCTLYRIIDPEVFAFINTVTMVIMVISGGKDRWPGPVGRRHASSG